MRPAAPYDTVQWRKLRPLIYDRDGGMCQVCDRPHRVSPHAYDVDHIIPWSEGGSWFDPTNLRLACPESNRGRVSGRLALAARINRTPAPAPSRDW